MKPKQAPIKNTTRTRTSSGTPAAAESPAKGSGAGRQEKPPKVAAAKGPSPDVKQLGKRCCQPVTNSKGGSPRSLPKAEPLAPGSVVSAVGTPALSTSPLVPSAEKVGGGLFSQGGPQKVAPRHARPKGFVRLSVSLPYVHWVAFEPRWEFLAVSCCCRTSSGAGLAISLFS